MAISRDRILYEDPHLLIVSKLAGELTVRGKGPLGKLPLFDFLKKDVPGLRVVHRLDFETSGAVLFAKSKEAYDVILSSDFTGWEKKYRTLVMGRVGRDTGVIRMKLPARGRGVVDAETTYTVLERFRMSSYVEATIATGRHHQIRRHFAMIKHPLVLDGEYGDRKFNGIFKQELRYHNFFLHAYTLAFPHPITKERVEVLSPMPRSFEDCLKKLRSL